MDKLHEILDKVGAATKKNKIAHTLFDAVHTFLFTPKETTAGKGVHIKDGIDLKRTMVHVVIAMQLCLIHGVINIGHQHYAALGMYPGLLDGFGWKFLYGLFQLLPVILVVHVVGLGIEILFAAKKGHAVEEGFLVSGMLIPLIMPPGLPLWMTAVATAFAVIIAKEAFGGTGMNILNVALTARVFVFFAYPTYISGDDVWVSYGYNTLHYIFGVEGNTLAHFGVDMWNYKAHLIDSFSGATPLALAAKGGWDAVMANFTVSDLFWGFIPGSVGEMNKPAIIFGIIFLVATGIASWRIMLSMLLGMIFTGAVFNLMPEANIFMQVPWYYHLMMGSFLFAMAYMATDPVTASQTHTGKLVYGFLIGAIGMIIRVINPAYPEGWMLAILVMNVFAPLIDHFVIQSNIQKRLSRVG